MMIQIKKINETTFDVAVTSLSTTSHRVTVLPSYASQLTRDKVSIEHLLEKSFEFLLAREPNTSILCSFELSVIERYFPEYISEMKKLLQS